MTEKSKLFRKMGFQVGIKAESKRQRGIIARRFMNKVGKLEADEFEKHCQRIKLDNFLRINDGDKVSYL